MKTKTLASEHKSYPSFSTKVIDEEEGIVEHIFAVFGNVDLGNDVLHPGSFAKSIAERGRQIKVLDLHNTNSILNIIGKPLEIREIGQDELPTELREEFPTASGGVLAKTQFLMDTPEGKGAFVRIKEGAVTEWSFGFDALDVDYETVKTNGKTSKIRNLRTIKLYEYSPVLWGMNPATATISSKADNDERKGESLYGRLEKISSAFHNTFETTDADGWPIYRVVDIFEGFLLATSAVVDPNIKFRVSFSEKGDIIEFATRNEWIEGTLEFIPAPVEAEAGQEPEAQMAGPDGPPPTKSDSEALLREIQLNLLEIDQLEV